MGSKCSKAKSQQPQCEINYASVSDTESNSDVATPRDEPIDDRHGPDVKSDVDELAKLKVNSPEYKELLIKIFEKIDISKAMLSHDNCQLLMLMDVVEQEPRVAKRLVEMVYDRYYSRRDQIRDKIVRRQELGLSTYGPDVKSDVDELAELEVNSTEFKLAFFKILQKIKGEDAINSTDNAVLLTFKNIPSNQHSAEQFAESTFRRYYYAYDLLRKNNMR